MSHSDKKNMYNNNNIIVISKIPGIYMGSMWVIPAEYRLGPVWVPFAIPAEYRLGPGWVPFVFSGGNPGRVPSGSRGQKPAGSRWVTRTGPVQGPGRDPSGYRTGWLAG